MRRKIFIYSDTWTTAKIASELGLSVRQIHYHISQGNLEAETMHSGSCLLISHDAAQRFVNDHKAGRFPVGNHK